MLKGSAKWPRLSLSQRKGEIMKVVVPGDRVYQKMQEKKVRLMSKFWNMIYTGRSCAACSLGRIGEFGEKSHLQGLKVDKWQSSRPELQDT